MVRTSAVIISMYSLYTYWPSVHVYYSDTLLDKLPVDCSVSSYKRQGYCDIVTLLVFYALCKCVSLMTYNGYIHFLYDLLR